MGTVRLRSGASMAPNEGSRDFWRLVVGFFVPPAGVFMQVGLTKQFWINVVLSVLLVWVGGQVHAAWVITNLKDDGSADPEGTGKLIGVLASYYVPPVGVLLKAGVGVGLVLNVVLWLLGWLPGVLHALWVITHDD